MGQSEHTVSISTPFLPHVHLLHAMLNRMILLLPNQEISVSLDSMNKQGYSHVTRVALMHHIMD
jgi:hypothetical protein